MITLASTLASFSKIDKLDLGPRKRVPLDRQLLREALRKAKRSNLWVFALVVAMVVGLFIVEIVLIVQNVGNEGRIEAIHGAFGITAAALIGTMVWLWKEWTRLDMLYSLAEFMDPATLQTIIDELVRSQVRAKNPQPKL